MKRLVFIESSDIGVRHTARASRKLGYEPLFLVDLQATQGDTRKQFELELRRGNVIDTPTVSALSLLRELSKNHIQKEDVAGVLSFLDSRLLISKELGRALGCDYSLDDAICTLKSKGSVAALIPEYSPASMRLLRGKTTVFELEDFLLKHENVILKPSQMAGAIGAKCFQNARVADLLRHIEQCDVPSHLNNNEWICQSFVEGPLYSAEGFVENGKVFFLGVSSRGKVGFSESQLSFPADVELNAELTQSYQEAISALVERSEFRDGFFHIEFICDKQKCLIIDANVGRLGGGPLGEMIPLAFQMDIEDFYAFVISLSLRMRSPLELRIQNSFPGRKRSSRKTIGICYGSLKEGFLKKVKLSPKRKFLHTQILNNKQEVPPMGLNNWSWIGIVTAYQDEFSPISKPIQLELAQGRELACY